MTKDDVTDFLEKLLGDEWHDVAWEIRRNFNRDDLRALKSAIDMLHKVRAGNRVIAAVALHGAVYARLGSEAKTGIERAIDLYKRKARKAAK